MRQSVASSVISIFPPGRRFLHAFRDLQAAVRELQYRTAIPPRPAAGTARAGEHDESLNRSWARALQLHGAATTPLLPGDLSLSETAIEVRGRAVVPYGLSKTAVFFINGKPFDTVAYPLEDPATQRLFGEIGGGGAFVARAAREIDSLQKAAFFRLDLSTTGVYLPHRWQQAIWIMNPAFERFPMPPSENMRRVVGDDSPVRFGMGGATIFRKIGAALEDMGLTYADFPRVLDWGCGAGRITRYLLSCTENEVHGADIDGENIRWCSANLAGGHFSRFPLAPPTSIPDGFFDLVIGASVVTHLTEAMQFAWLAELQRVTRPGALLFLSISGATQFAHLGIPPALFGRVQREGLLDSGRDPALGDHIESTWHSPAYVAQAWSRYFDVLAIIDGIAALQDFVVLRRRDG